jgi:phospholipid/cholesterol/gamma-HCH transport system substrate-binding protein
METKVNYTIVGAFVLVLSAAIVAGVLWLSSGKGQRKDYDRYVTYFTESVGGLNLNAPVRYHGVEVGAVREIGLDPGDPERVRILLDVQRGTPVRADTVAVLRVGALTGIAYVDLGGGSKEAPPLTAEPGQPYPVIQTQPSMLVRLDAGLNTLIANLTTTSQSVTDMLDEQNRRALKQTLQDLQRVTHALASRSGDIDRAVAGAARTLENTAQASAELSRLIERVGRGADAVERMANEVAGAGAAARVTMEGARRAVDDAGTGVRQLSGEALPELGRLVAEARQLTASLTRVSQELERNPSILLLGKQPAQPGPGE